MNRNRKKVVFRENDPSVSTVLSGVHGAVLSHVVNGTSQPPKNNVAMSADAVTMLDRKSTRLNSSHLVISYAVFCLKKKIGLIRTIVCAWYTGVSGTAAKRMLTRQS